MLGSNSAWGVFMWESSIPLLSFFSPSHRPSLFASLLISLIKHIHCSPPAIALQQQIRQSARIHTYIVCCWEMGSCLKWPGRDRRITDRQRYKLWSQGTHTHTQICDFFCFPLTYDKKYKLRQDAYTLTFTHRCKACTPEVGNSQTWSTLLTSISKGIWQIAVRWWNGVYVCFR